MVSIIAPRLAWTFVGIAAAAGADAQQGSSSPAFPSRSRASRLVQTRQFEAARPHLEQIVAADADDGVSWLQLGIVELQAGRHERAKEALTKAARQPALAARARFDLACLHARVGEVDASLDALEAAVAAGFLALARISIEPDLQPVRDRDRYRSLLDELRRGPRFLASQARPDADQETTFAEPEAEVLWTFTSENGLDRFGWQSEAIGDVDDDGIEDILVGGPRCSERVERGGKVWLLSGIDGTLLRSHHGHDLGGHFGFRVKSAGDLDEDGVPDYLVSAPGGNARDGSVPPDDAGLDVSGAVFIYSGGNGELLRRFSGFEASERLGFDAAMVGDLNADGLPDYALGAPGNDSSAPNGGALHLVSGADGTLIRSRHGEVSLGRLGSAVGAVPDLDGDGVVDLVIGAPGEGAGRGGRAHVLSGASGEARFVLDPAQALPEARALEFGRFFASPAGDLDRDGVGDLYVADCFDQTHGLTSGRVYLWSGRTGELLRSIAGQESGDWYGIGRSLREDLTGDGVPELVLASLASGDAAPFGGRVDVIDGSDGTRRASYTGATPWLSLGYDVHPVGDADDDGITDYFVTAGWAAWRPDLPGRGVLLRGRPLPRH